MLALLILVLFPITLTCLLRTPFTEEPKHGMGVRFTQRGLEKFCQKGYTIVPDIIASMPPFQIEGITLGPLTLTISNIKPRAVRVSTMKVYFQDNNYVKMEVRDGLMQLSMRIEASLMGGTGSVDCIISLKDFGGDISLQIGDDKDCPYHFGMFDIKSVPLTSGLTIDAVGLDAIGSILANTLQGMAPALDTLMKNIILQSLLNTIFVAIKQSMLNLPLVSQLDDYFTDQRYINGINIIDKKIVTNQGGMITIADKTDFKRRAPYPNPILSPVPKIIYTDRDYEFYVDRESINSYIYALHIVYYQFRAQSYPIKYSDIKAQNIPDLAQALVDVQILNSLDDPGTDVTIVLSVEPCNDAPHITWIGAASLPTIFKEKLVVTANKKSVPDSKTLVDIDGDMLFSSVLKLKKYTFGFANDQARAYLELNGLYNVTITRKVDGGMDNPEPLIEYLVSEVYLPILNSILSYPGICLMNGNFIDYSTLTAIHLCDEDRVLFVADIEKNPYFI